MTKEVTITYNDDSKAKVVSEHSINMLKSLAAAAGLSHLEITSTLRTAESQAAAMYYNVLNTGYEQQFELYGPVGTAVLNAALKMENSLPSDLSEEEKSELIVSEMIAEINRQYPKRVSRHVVPLEDYARLNVLDIGYDSVLDKEAFRAVLSDAKARGIIEFIDEPYNECFHIEIAAGSQLYTPDGTVS